MSSTAIHLEGIVKRYGTHIALDGVSLEVPEGSFFALLGPNGAGKTTLLRLLLGLIHRDGGRGEVLGAPIGPGYPSASLKARIGYVPERSALYERANADELISFCRGMNPRWDDRTAERYLDLFGLSRKTTVRQMSTGMRAQLSLTLAMGGNPELLILDEPTQGLDPLHRHQYLKVLLSDSMESGRTVLLSSHDLHQIERLADSVAILKEGRVAVTLPLDQLQEREKRLRVSGTVTEETLSALPAPLAAHIRRVSGDGLGLLLHVSGGAEELRDYLAARPGVTGVQVINQSLEEIFLSYAEKPAG